MVKPADTPSCLEGGENGTNLKTNHSVKVRILPLQQTDRKNKTVVHLNKKRSQGRFFFVKLPKLLITNTMKNIKILPLRLLVSFFTILITAFSFYSCERDMASSPNYVIFFIGPNLLRLGTNKKRHIIIKTNFF